MTNKQAFVAGKQGGKTRMFFQMMTGLSLDDVLEAAIHAQKQGGAQGSKARKGGRDYEVPTSSMHPGGHLTCLE